MIFAPIVQRAAEREWRMRGPFDVRPLINESRDLEVEIEEALANVSRFRVSLSFICLTLCYRSSSSMRLRYSRGVYVLLTLCLYLYDILGLDMFHVLIPF